ncbi:MAG: phosphoribosyltransferase family protein, partial [Pseudomonadota bacterium]|nr:phosphoribosyltransferase family protein [Pseudomonadota bacterium]
RLPNIRQNVVSQSFTDYTNESNAFEVNKQLIKKGDRVLLIDDWVEKGGQLKGLVQLLEKRGAEVSGIAVLGFNRIGKTQRFASKYNVSSIIDYHLSGKRDLTKRLDLD